MLQWLLSPPLAGNWVRLCGLALQGMGTHFVAQPQMAHVAQQWRFGFATGLSICEEDWR